MSAVTPPAAMPIIAPILKSPFLLLICKVHHAWWETNKKLLTSLVVSVILVVLRKGVLAVVMLSSCAAVFNWLQTIISNDSTNIVFKREQILN